MTEEFIRANFCEAGIAKQMRELGFDEPCFGYYDHEQFNFDDAFKTNAAIKQYLAPGLYIKYFCSAPTYWQAIQWLRGKGIQIIEIGYYPTHYDVIILEGGFTKFTGLLIDEAIESALSILKQQQNTNT